ncbi:MAG: alpha/beta hydrolase, partial [Firmicutes bacterium]|nr:alpha/beta hydrolase [Bacillota bacterium]
SIGAFFSMNADISRDIKKAYFISPVVDMEKLIGDMMKYANVTERELNEKKVIKTDFGEELSWEYLSYVRKHPLNWTAPTEILYGGRDNITSFETIKKFADEHNAKLTVMQNGEHWFHTNEQLEFLDNWIRSV